MYCYRTKNERKDIILSTSIYRYDDEELDEGIMCRPIRCDNGTLAFFLQVGDKP
jgi:hypothetical protein